MIKKLNRKYTPASKTMKKTDINRKTGQSDDQIKNEIPQEISEKEPCEAVNADMKSGSVIRLNRRTLISSFRQLKPGTEGTVPAVRRPGLLCICKTAVHPLFSSITL